MEKTTKPHRFSVIFTSLLSGTTRHSGKRELEAKSANGSVKALGKLNETVFSNGAALGNAWLEAKSANGSAKARGELNETVFSNGAALGKACA